MSTPIDIDLAMVDKICDSKENQSDRIYVDNVLHIKICLSTFTTLIYDKKYLPWQATVRRYRK